MRRALAVARFEFKILRYDFMPLVILAAMPIGSMAIFRGAMRGALEFLGFKGVNGSEQVVPGFLVLSAFFVPAFVGISFVREHGWFTWERLQSTALRQWEIVVGKALPWLVVGVLHSMVVLAAGALLFDLKIRGPVLALLPLQVAVPAFAVLFGLLLVTVVKSIQQMNAYALLGSIALAGLGGALAPRELLPSWAAHIAPLTPTYWAMRGYRSVVLDGAGVGAVLLPCAILLAATAVCAVLAGIRFRFDDVKLSYV